MRLAHAVHVTPKRCGLYETAREIVAAERALGHDARMLDPLVAVEDRGAPIDRNAFLDEADILISHSGLSNRMRKSGKPVIHVIHGRPRSSFLLEHNRKNAIYSHFRAVRKEETAKAFVTFWEEHLPYFGIMLHPREVLRIPPPVDLKHWTPDGPKGYKFHGKKGKINVVCAEAWRDDIDPFHVINAFALYAPKHPGARLHLYNVNPQDTALKALLAPIAELGALGEVTPRLKDGLEHIYRAADFVISPQRIATRSIREPLACGCPVVSGGPIGVVSACADPANPVIFAKAMESAMDIRRDATRTRAEAMFNPENTAKALLKIAESILQ